ncbi:MAG TPA: PRC-barrel domain-containing protein [Thermodesulfobacteriota bacterium]|nr:PRC-barrel domain-containing protein [Thermodesulfobacteriota bacterium]
MRRGIVLLTALIFVNFGLFAYLAADQAETENQQQVIVVKDSTGQYVGTITNVLADSSGDITFIILSISEPGEPGNKEIAIPLGILSYDDEKGMILNLSKEELAAAPGFDVSDLSDSTFAEKVYRFFGLVPAWDE